MRNPLIRKWKIHRLVRCAEISIYERLECCLPPDKLNEAIDIITMELSEKVYDRLAFGKR